MILFTQTVLQQARYNTPLFKSPKERKSNASPRGEHCSHLLSQTALLWFEQPDSETLLKHLNSWFIVGFVWGLCDSIPTGSWGLHRLVAMDVRQTCARWKKISPEAPLSRLHICALCGPSAGKPHNAEWKHAVLGDSLTDRQLEEGGREKKRRTQRPSPPSLLFFSLHFLVAQQTFFLLWNFLTGSSQVCLRIKMLWKNCLQKCNEPFLQDEFCFDALLTINSSRARFHCLKPPIVFFSPHKRCPWRFFLKNKNIPEFTRGKKKI